MPRLLRGQDLPGSSLASRCHPSRPIRGRCHPQLLGTSPASRRRPAGTPPRCRDPASRDHRLEPRAPPLLTWPLCAPCGRLDQRPLHLVVFPALSLCGSSLRSLALAKSQRSFRTVACSRCGQLAPPSELTPGAFSSVCSVCVITTTHPGQHSEPPIDLPSPKRKRPRSKPTESPS